MLTTQERKRYQLQKEDVSESTDILEGSKYANIDQHNVKERQKDKAEGHTSKCDQCIKLEKRIIDFESLYDEKTKQINEDLKKRREYFSHFMDLS